MARDKNKPERLRLDAVRRIGESKLPNRVTLLEEIYKGNMENLRLRRQVTNLLGFIKDAQAVNVLANIAAGDPEFAVRSSAVQQLGQMRTPEAMKALEDYLMKRKP
jgi:HEAT repeat protein